MKKIPVIHIGRGRLSRRVLCAIALLAAFACVVPVAAEANLSLKAGRKAVKRKALNSRWGYAPGSGVFFCGKHGRNYVTCDVLFNDADGDAWCGSGAARRRKSGVHAWLNVGMEGCQYFKRASATPGLTTASALRARLRMCSNTYGGDVIQARNLRCRKARRIVRTWAHRYKRDGKVNRRVLRFRCRDRSDPVEGLVVRCKRHHASVTFYANVP